MSSTPSLTIELSDVYGGELGLGSWGSEAGWHARGICEILEQLQLLLLGLNEHLHHLLLVVGVLSQNVLLLVAIHERLHLHQLDFLLGIL